MYTRHAQPDAQPDQLYSLHHCPRHGRTVWIIGRAIGVRRTPAGQLHTFHATIPAGCPVCREETIAAIARS